MDRLGLTGIAFRLRVVFTRGVGSVLQFGLNVLLGRLLGPAGAGVYFLFSSWVRTLSVASNLGLPLSVLRELSIARQQGRHADARATVRGAVVSTLVVGGIVVAAVVAFGPQAARWLGDPAATQLVRLSALGALLFALRRVQTEALKAYGQPAFAVAVDSPLLAAGLIATVGLAATLGPLTAMVPVYAFLGVNVALLALGAWRFRDALGAEEARDAPVPSRIRGPARARYLLWGVAVASIVSTEAPFLVLPRFATEAEVGTFGAAFRLVALATTLMGALAATFGPRFAQAYAAGHAAALRRALLRSQGASLLLYAPFAVAYIAAPRWVLGWFGDGFAEGAQVLLILVVAQIVDAATGLSGYVLTMTGAERTLLALTAAGFVVFIASVAVLGPRLGVEGVAVSFAAMLTVRSVAVYWAAVRRSRVAATEPADGPTP